MKYKGKYKAYIGLILINAGMHIIQLGTMTDEEAKKRRKKWKLQGFDWIIWRQPTTIEVQEAKIYTPIYEAVPNPLTEE